MEHNIGITGATGTLGKILVKKLEERGLNYSCFDGDIRSRNDIEEWLKKNKADVVIHLAAIVPVPEVEENPRKASQISVDGMNNLICEIKNSQQNPWVFYASTSHVYKSKNALINEADEIGPISLYGKIKYEAERIATENYNNLCVGRIFSLYHKTQKGSFLYPNIIKRLSSEDLSKPFELYGANSIRDFLNAEDIADIIIKLMERRARGIYNIGSGKGTSIRDFVQNLTDKKLNIKEMGNNNYLVANIDKLNEVLKNEK